MENPLQSKNTFIFRKKTREKFEIVANHSLGMRIQLYIVVRFLILVLQLNRANILKRVTIDPPAKVHLNAVFLAGRWWPAIYAGWV